MALVVTERLGAVRAEVDQVCQLLLSPTPESMDRCSERLAAAVAEMTACQASGENLHPDKGPANVGPDDALLEARRLEQSLSRAHRLLEGAAAFHRNWLRWLGAMCAGYTVHGEPAAVERGSRVVVRG